MPDKQQVSEHRAAEIDESRQEPPTPSARTPAPQNYAQPPQDITSRQRSVALTWLSRGIPVVPCSRTDKAAMVAGFGARADVDELAKFSDPEQVRAWWSGRFKRAHVGLLTRRLVVVDLDVPKDGRPPLKGRWEGCQAGTDVLELLAREHGQEWPDTYSVMTPSGGLHLYFQQPDGDPIGCATGDGAAGPHIGPLVDVRGVGGYVIGAGSYSTAQGRPYERVSPPDVGPQPVPGWLLEILRRPAPPRAAPATAPIPAAGNRSERYATAAIEGAVDDIKAAAEGTLNNTLFARARRLGELSSTAPAVLTESVVEEQLLAAAVAAGHPENGARNTIRSGWSTGVHDGFGAGAA